MNRHRLSFLAATIFLLVACAHSDPSKEQCQGLDQCHSFAKDKANVGMHLSQAEAVSIAKAEASRHGQDSEGYKEPSASYQNGVWFISFEAKATPPAAPALGNGFAVWVDENTQTTFYSPGR